MRSIIATGIAATAIGAAVVLPGAAPAFAASSTVHAVVAPVAASPTAGTADGGQAADGSSTDSGTITGGSGTSTPGATGGGAGKSTIVPGYVKIQGKPADTARVHTPDTLSITGMCPSNATAVAAIESLAFAGGKATLGPAPGMSAGAAGVKFEATAQVLPDLAFKSYPLVVKCTGGADITTRLTVGPSTPAPPAHTTTPATPPNHTTPPNHIPKGAPDTGVVTGSAPQSPLREVGTGAGVLAAVGVCAFLGRRWKRAHQQ